MAQEETVTIVYDGDGNRVSETVGGTTTSYLVDSLNRTGYAQVVDEFQNGTVTRSYSYGLELTSGTLTTSFYGYNGYRAGGPLSVVCLWVLRRKCGCPALVVFAMVRMA